MHTTQTSLLIRAGQDGYPGAAFEDARQLIEPSHLASGEPSRPGGDEILCLLQGERPREVPGELAHPYGVHDLGAYSLSGGDHVPESLGFAQAIPCYPPRPPIDGGVDGWPLGAEVDDGSIVTEASFPDRSPGFGPGQLQFFRPRGPARVGFMGGRLLRLLA